MSRLLLILILASLSGSVTFAQVTKGRVGSSPATQTTLSPHPAAKTSTAPAATSAVANDRSSTQPASQNHTISPSTTSYGNTSVKRSSQERAARPSDPKRNRPATYAPPTNDMIAKGNTGATTKKVAPIKASERGKVNWMSLEQALERSKTEKRKIFLDMYTERCVWCKHMDSTTFVDVAVAKYLNEHFYPVKFNAEQEQDIVFKDKTYKFKKNGTSGYHELAAFWLNNRLSFPTIVFLDENQQPIQSLAGYQNSDKMETIINYYGSDSHKKTPWESYEKNFTNKK